MNWNIFNPQAIGRALARSFTTSDFVRRWTETLSDIAGILRNLWLDVRDSYRPELNYMRGPGPKWRAKQQRRVTSVLSVSYPQYRTMLRNPHAVIGTRNGAGPLGGSFGRCREHSTTMRFRMSPATAFTLVDERRAFAPTFCRILQDMCDSEKTPIVL